MDKIEKCLLLRIIIVKLREFLTTSSKEALLFLIYEIVMVATLATDLEMVAAIKVQNSKV